MATQPVICPVPEVPGFTFSRGSLVLDDGTKTTPPVYLDLKDMKEELVSFSKSRVILKADKCFLLSQTDIGNNQGYVSFIAVKAVYPDLTVESKKYINWTYLNNTNYMGELMVLTGPMLSSVSSTPEGWNLSKPNVVFNDGGMVFCNPSADFTVKLEILVCK